MRKLHHSWHVIRKFPSKTLRFSVLLSHKNVQIFNSVYIRLFYVACFSIFFNEWMFFAKLSQTEQKKVHTFMTKKPAHKKKYTTTSRSRHIKNNKKNNKKSKLSSLEKFLMCVCFSETKKRILLVFLFHHDKKRM